MSKKTTFFASILLVAASIIIYLLVEESTTKMDVGLVKAFSGMLMGAGIAISVQQFFGKKKEKSIGN